MLVAAEPQSSVPKSCWWVMPASLKGQMCDELRVVGGAVGLWEALWSPNPLK